MTNPIVFLSHQLQTGDVVLGMVLVLLASYMAIHLLWFARVMPPRRWSQRFAAFAWQIGAMLGLEQAYEFTRGQIPHETDIAMLNAYRVLDLEWRHGFFIESRIERYFLHFHTVMNAVDLFYVLAHAGVTIGVLAWIYLRRQEKYAAVRNLMMMTTAIALVVFYVFPTAPPRLLPNYGFVDPLLAHHFVGPGGSQPDSYTYNPYAAMPSLHVAYAIIVAFGLITSVRNLAARSIAIAYPFAMAAAVVISGNHWLLDVVGAALAVGLSGLFLVALSWMLLHVRAERFHLAVASSEPPPVMKSAP